MSLNGDAFLDSEDLMAWLLLNPEMDFDHLTSSLPDDALADSLTDTHIDAHTGAHVHTVDTHMLSHADPLAHNLAHTHTHVSVGGGGAQCLGSENDCLAGSLPLSAPVAVPPVSVCAPVPVSGSLSVPVPVSSAHAQPLQYFEVYGPAHNTHTAHNAHTAHTAHIIHPAHTHVYPGHPLSQTHTQAHIVPHTQPHTLSPHSQVLADFPYPTNILPAYTHAHAQAPMAHTDNAHTAHTSLTLDNGICVKTEPTGLLSSSSLSAKRKRSAPPTLTHTLSSQSLTQPTPSPRTLTHSLSSHTLQSTLTQSTTHTLTQSQTQAPAPSQSRSKKRSREDAEELEARVQQLQRENADLHAHLLTVTQRTTEVQRQRVAMERLMTQRLLESEARERARQRDGEPLTESEREREREEDAQLAEIVKQYTDIYADYGRCRQREISFHLQQLEQLIVPTLTTKMCLWTLQQDRSFYQRQHSPVFDMLCKELEITPEQTERIVQRRERIKYLLSQLRESLSLLQELKAATEKKHASYDHVCGRVQNAAHAKQTVQFLIWITRNADRLAQFVPGFTVRNAYVPPAEFVAEMMSMQTADSSSSSVKKE